ncbi:MAG: DUF438 domain-containing protein [Tissierellia bacterium]|nr:DUF438 domain-containing protein [Tissierellia bacterium]
MNSIMEKLRVYLNRLESNEKLEIVRADFVKDFINISHKEFLDLIKKLPKDTDEESLKTLSDIHSSLFEDASNGVIEKEKIKNELLEIKGHPLNFYSRENKAIIKLIDSIENALKNNEQIKANDIKNLKGVSIHYASKGDLIYPHLSVKYGIIGPSNIMWTTDDNIRDKINRAIKKVESNKLNEEFLKELLKDIRQMVVREEDILFSLCAFNFTKEEWAQIYIDMKEYENFYQIEEYRWEYGENFSESDLEKIDGEIVLPGGSFTAEELRAILNTIPMEITFVDRNDINKFFNEGPKDFKRPKMAIGRNVYSCHPPIVEKMARKIIDDFKNNVKDEVKIKMNKDGANVLVSYHALRNENGEYLGTMELVQNIDFEE